MTLSKALRAPSAATAESLVVANGERISFRQVGPGDRDGLAALFARLTPESRYRRFLSPKPELTPRELTYFTEIDHVNHEAIAAVDQRDDSIVGVARYVRHADRTDVAELAIEVADAFQRMGIGTALTSLTIHHAHANGLTSLTATTLWENHAARRLLRHHGFRARQSRGGQIEHELKLEELAAACVDEPATEVGSAVSRRTKHASHEYGPHTVWLLARKPVAAFRHTSHPSLGGGARGAQATREEGPTNTTTTQEATK